MGKSHLLKLISASFVLLIFTYSNVFAKSTDKKKFLNLHKEASNQINKNKGSSKSSYNLIKKIDQEFNVAKINVDMNIKADFYLIRCDNFHLYSKDRQKIIDYCIESDEFNTSNQIYKRKKYKGIEFLWAHIIALNAGRGFLLQNNKDNLNIAKKYIEKNLKLKNSKEYEFEYLGALQNLTGIYKAEGKIKEAIKTQMLFLNGKKCFKNYFKNKNLLNKCHTEKLNLSVLLMESNKKDKSEGVKILFKMLSDKNLNEDNRQSLTGNLSSFYLANDKYELAEKYKIESISLLKTESGGTNSKEDYYDSVGGLYNIYRLRGYTNEAIKGYRELIIEIESDFGKDSVVLLNPLSNLMQIYGNYYEFLLEAEKIQKKIISIKKNNPNYLPGSHVHYGSIAEIYDKSKNFKEAEKYWLKAIESDPYGGGTLMAPLIRTKLSLNKNKEAEKLIKTFIPNGIYEQISLLALKDTLFNRQKKIHSYKENFVNLFMLASDYNRGLLPNYKEGNIKFYDQAILGAFNNLTNLSQKDFKIVSNHFKKETNKTIETGIIELIEMMRSSKFNQRVENVIDRSINPIVAADKRKLQDLIIDFEKMPKNYQDRDERKRNMRDIKLVKGKISKQKEIIFSKLNIKSISSSLNDVLLSDIRNEINDDQAIISYFIDINSVYILGITNNNFTINKKKINNKQFSKLIAKVIKSVKISETGKLNKFDFKNSKIIYDIILKPVENIILDKKELIIIPHKSLSSLPIEILVSNKTKATNLFIYSKVDWVGKKFAISYYPSIYSFYNLKKVNFSKAKYSFLGLGNPDLRSSNKAVTKKMDYSKLMSRGVANSDEIRKMNNLPETADELNFIANIFKKNSKLYLGKDFNEKKIKSLDLSNYRFISFATHAVIANQINNIAEPGLILTPPKKSTKDNDGILTVTEIEKLNLNSDIVILSACNTASNDGSPNGEGLSGLTSAFFQAGTKSMLVTHWDVETNSAVKLTTGALSRYNKETNLAVALQKTKIEMISNDETSHPFFWAPFTLIGNIQGN